MNLATALGAKGKALEHGLFEPYTRSNGKPVVLSARLSEGTTTSVRNSAGLAEAKSFIELWKDTDVSWRNDLPEYLEPLPETYELGILEETDLAAGATLESMLGMLLEHMRDKEAESAGQRWERILLVDESLHDPVAKRLADAPGWRVVAKRCHVHRLLMGASRVLVIGSLVGLDALLRERNVAVLGSPFYSSKPIHDVVAEHIYSLGGYWHPEKGEITTPDDLVKWLALQRQHRFRFIGEIHALGFSRWKHRLLEDYIQGAVVVRKSKHHLGKLASGAQIAIWGNRDQGSGIRTDSVIRVEDAFIRSIGLGAQLIRPVSWVLDDVGLYYDPSKPSRLELILSRERFSEELLERSRKLRQRLIEEKITKYNVGRWGWHPKAEAEHTILVVGQVEDDASIRLGTQKISRNIDLLKNVRETNPVAYVVYKPHPDVLSKLRKEGEGESDAQKFCDELAIDCSIAELLEVVDEVHVMTSLAGFEALLRGKKVVTYGQPFYSSWGLTHDKAPLARRQRKLSLDELVAGTLFLYPTYVSLKTGYYMTPEDALNQLIEWRDERTYDPSFVEKLMVRARRSAIAAKKGVERVFRIVKLSS